MKARHRVPLGSRLQRYEEPASSHDPRVRAVVAQLQALELPGPRPNFRAELRAQLVAVAPRLVEDGVAEQRQRQAVRDERRVSTESEARRPRIRIGRPLAVVATLVTLCALVLGGAVWQSRKALPGDTLYGLKRASESVQLTFDSSDTERATDYLHFSQTRVDEAQLLLKRASAAGTGRQADGTSSTTVRELTSTLDAADSQLNDGWNLLSTAATKSRSRAPLLTMKNWAPGQITRLKTLRHSMRTPALRDRANESITNANDALSKADKQTRTLDTSTSSPAAPTNGTNKHTGGGSAGNGTATTHPTPTRASSGTTPTASRPAGKAAKHATESPSTAATPSKTPKALLPSLIRPLAPAHKPRPKSCVSLPVGVHVGACSSHS